MNIIEEINKRTAKLNQILGKTNDALVQKNSYEVEDIDSVPESIEGIVIQPGISPDKLSKVEVKSTSESYYAVIPEGYDAIKEVYVEGDEDLKGENILSGVEILGVQGTFSVYPNKISRTYTTNGTRTISLPTGYQAMKEVEVKVNVPTNAQLEQKTDVITSNGQKIYTPSSGKDGFSKVTINVNVPQNVIQQVIEAKLGSKTITPKSYSQNFWATNDNLDGYDHVSIGTSPNLVGKNIVAGIQIFDVMGTHECKKAQIESSKTVTPGRQVKTVTPSSGYDGLGVVYVETSPNLIESNIKDGITIFDVTGTYKPPGTDQLQEKTVRPSRSVQQISCDEGYLGLSVVTVETDPKLKESNIADGVEIFGVMGSYVSPTYQTSVKMTKPTQTFTPDNNYVGFNELTVEANLMEGNFTSTETRQEFIPDKDCIGFSKVTIEATPRTGDYNEGHKDGYNLGYDKGHEAGKVEGFQEGSDSRQQEIDQLEQEKDDAYNKGFSEGTEAGKAYYSQLDEIAW